MALAAKIPYDHPYAGGFPGIGSQPLPTDSDCLTYLAAVKAADGAGVETGVAVAVDAFFRDTKAAGVFSALKACCILAGARTLAGALVPVVGTAPTNVANGFVSGDYSRTSGLTGDGATTYLDSGRNNNADPQNSKHASVYVSALPTSGANQFPRMLSSGNTLAADTIIHRNQNNGSLITNVNATSFNSPAAADGFLGVSRASSGSYVFRGDGSSTTFNISSGTPRNANIGIFASVDGLQPANATIAFYSIGTSLSLEDLDTAVTNLITAIGEAL